MKKMLGDIIELIISIIALVAFAVLFVLVVTVHKYLFLIGSIYAAINIADMWENIVIYSRQAKKVKMAINN